jgi:hypothetical protein
MFLYLFKQRGCKIQIICKSLVQKGYSSIPVNSWEIRIEFMHLCVKITFTDAINNWIQISL